MRPMGIFKPVGILPRLLAYSPTRPSSPFSLGAKFGPFQPTLQSLESSLIFVFFTSKIRNFSLLNRKFRTIHSPHTTTKNQKIHPYFPFFTPEFQIFALFLAFLPLLFAYFGLNLHLCDRFGIKPRFAPYNKRQIQECQSRPLDALAEVLNLNFLR